MFDYQNNDNNTDEELAEAAAKVLYEPGNEFDASLRYVIENLVLPEGITGYTQEEMKQCILNKLKSIDRPKKVTIQ